MKLKDKVVVVTGGGSGIGREISLHCAREGGTVVVADRDVETANTTAKDIRDAGSESLALETEVTRSASVHEMAKRSVDEFGRIDLLVNNAGIQVRQPLLDYDEGTWRKIIDVNLIGPFLCTQACALPMKEAGGGSIVNIASIAGMVPSSHISAYVSAKAGLIGFTKVAACELSPFGITVNAVSPGIIETPLTAEYFTRPSFVAKMEEEIPSRRWGQPVDVAAAVIWLGTQDASYVTGQTLAVDGGWTTSKELHPPSRLAEERGES